MSSTDEQMAERRRKNFAVRAERVREPEFEGEKLIFITYNGRQEYTTNLAPHEARKLYDLLGAEFGLSHAADCRMCNNSGIVGRPPDNYYDCPDCVAARAVQQAPDAARDAERLDFLSRCVMDFGAISAGREHDPMQGSPTFGPLPTVTLFTVPSQHVRGVGLRDAIDAAIALKSLPALKLAEDGKGE